MSKRRNYNEKLQKRNERDMQHRTNVLTVTVVSVIVAVMLIATAYMWVMPGKVVLRNIDGAYVDPSTGIVYRAATPFVYEPKSVYASEKDVYGVMDGSNVYEIEGIGTDKLLARELFEGLVTVYYAEGYELPDIKDFGAVGVIVFEDGAISVEQTRITDKERVASLVEEYVKGDEVSKPEGITATYNLRFVSEKYPYLYYCVQLVRAEQGDFYCDHEIGKYYPAPSDIGDAIDTARGEANG